MQSHTKHTSSYMRNAASHGHQTDDHSPDQTNLRTSRKDPRNPPSMLSDPIDSPSSDTKSFDEDDMYGSDSDVETISLKPDSDEQTRVVNEHMV